MISVSATSVVLLLLFSTIMLRRPPFGATKADLVAGFSVIAMLGIIAWSVWR